MNNYLRFHILINLNHMLTESSTAIQQTMALLLRLHQKLLSHLDISQSPNKIDPSIYLSQSPIYQIALQIESLLKILIKQSQVEQKSYELQLQKCEQKLRKHAKNHCEMKLYCEHLQEELRISNDQRNKIEAQFAILTMNYNKEIQTLRTELSNAILIKNNDPDQPIDSSRKRSLKPANTISKIKLRLMNLGISQYNEPLSCANTLRKDIPSSQEQQRPFSEPTSLSNSPHSNLQNPNKQKQFKKKKSSKKDLKSKSKSVLTKDEKKYNSVKQTKMKGSIKN